MHIFNMIMCLFPRAAVRKYPKLGDLKDGNLLSHSSGG